MLPVQVDIVDLTVHFFLSFSENNHVFIYVYQKKMYPGRIEKKIVIHNTQICFNLILLKNSKLGIKV